VRKNSEAPNRLSGDLYLQAGRRAPAAERHGFRVDGRPGPSTSFRIAYRDYVKYRYVKEWYFRWMPRSLFRALERRYGWHLLLTAQG